MKPDLVSVIETAYRAADSDDAWLTSVLEAMRSALPGAKLGVKGMFFDVSDPARPRAWCPGVCAVGCPDGWDERAWVDQSRAGMLGMFQALSAGPLLEKVWRRTRSGITASQLVGRDVWTKMPARSKFMLAMGAKDFVRVVCSDATHRGCVVMGALPSVRSVPRRQTVQLQRLGAHVATGLRLHRRLDAGADRDGEAILHPDGRVAHASTSAKPAAARAALRAFARSLDRARGRLRRSDPDAAVELWEGLASGRWSLVDRFDTDGRRYLVAHRNDPDVASPNALALVERQVAAYAAMGHGNKLIAYELGLSSSTVSTHLAAAMLKLGVRSRAALVRLLGAIVPAPRA